MYIIVILNEVMFNHNNSHKNNKNIFITNMCITEVAGKRNPLNIYLNYLMLQFRIDIKCFPNFSLFKNYFIHKI